MNEQQNEDFQNFYIGLEQTGSVCSECIEELRKDTVIYLLNINLTDFGNYTTLHTRCLMEIINFLKEGSIRIQELSRLLRES